MSKLAEKLIRRQRRELARAQWNEEDSEVAYRFRIRSPFTDVTDPVKRFFEKRKLRTERVKAEKALLKSVNRKKGRTRNG